MDQPELVVVLARIPDLHRGGGDAEPGSTHPHSGGRLLSPALSFALLAGGTILLVTVAVFGFRTVKNDPPADSQIAADPLPAWRPGPPSPVANIAPDWSPKVTQPKEPAKEIQVVAQVASSGEEEPLTWQGFCSRFDTKSGPAAASIANRSMTLNCQLDVAREYQADARTGYPYPRERTPSTTYPETQTP